MFYYSKSYFNSASYFEHVYLHEDVVKQKKKQQRDAKKSGTISLVFFANTEILVFLLLFFPAILEVIQQRKTHQPLGVSSSKLLNSPCIRW